ncbi:MAG: hypothetical protein LUC24_02355 [Bacteroidales bacterium]|nr:hypothetical protein [Bacteroidales bacterium]
MKGKFDYTDDEGARDGVLSFAACGVKKDKEPFRFTSSISSVDEDGKTSSIDTSKMDNAATFYQNYKYWNKETRLLSVNNFDNYHFSEIVKMGSAAVPFIVKEIESHPSQLVHALDLIFPGVMQYNGFVSIKEACEKWVALLK